jgi:hypothetical protein
VAEVVIGLIFVIIGTAMTANLWGLADQHHEYNLRLWRRWAPGSRVARWVLHVSPPWTTRLAWASWILLGLAALIDAAVRSI